MPFVLRVAFFFRQQKTTREIIVNDVSDLVVNKKAPPNDGAFNMLYYRIKRSILLLAPGSLLQLLK